MANVEVRESEAEFSKRVVELNLADKTWRTIESLPERSGGFWGGFQNPHDQTLYIGDTDSDGKNGRFIVLSGGNRREIPLQMAPYSGAFIVLD